jgi:hypothetical protein
MVVTRQAADFDRIGSKLSSSGLHGGVRSSEQGRPDAVGDDLTNATLKNNAINHLGKWRYANGDVDEPEAYFVPLETTSVLMVD